MEFPGMTNDQEKNNVEYPGALVLGLKTFEGCNTFLWSF